MENTDWREIIDCVVFMHNYGFHDDIISGVLEINLAYVYAILLEYCGVLGWNERKEINNDSRITRFW